MPAWREYQETVAELFRDLGFEAQTDKRIDGVRTSHDIDVFATFRHAGLHLTWLVECKLWRSPVSKVHVLALRSIVEDVGADRGVLLSESGFQSGAVEATSRSNVTVARMADFRREAVETLERRRLIALPERIAANVSRYWTIPKDLRERAALRPEGPTYGYSAASVLRTCSEVTEAALAGIFPPRPFVGQPLDVRSRSEAATVVELLLDDVELRLDEAESRFSARERDEIEARRLLDRSPTDHTADRRDFLTLVLSRLLHIPYPDAKERMRHTRLDG